MTPINALYRQADAHPDRTVFISGDAVYTYQNLVTKTERLARALLARGIRQGDRIALHMDNVPEMAIAYYACFLIGAIASPLNLRFKTAELRQILQRLQPALYLGEELHYSKIEAIEPEILAPEVRFITGPTAEYRAARPWAKLIEGDDHRTIQLQPDMNVPAVLLTTSGTTGQPKFVTHTPATLAAMTDAFAHFALNDEQIAVNACPMVHGSGFLTFLACVRFGAPMALLERFDPDAALNAIEAHRCTWMLGLPFMFQVMLERQVVQPRKIGSLQFCVSGGDVCPVQLQQQFQPVFGVPLRSAWAMSETIGSLIYGLKPGPVSRIAPGAQVRLVDDHGNPAQRGAVGELLVRGPGVTVGYWAGPNQINDATSDGWFHTGDLMRQGEGDELWFVSRKKDLIIRGGSNITPAEVEHVLMAHPLVKDAAVFGVPDPVLGQRVAGIVQLEAGVSSAALGEILTNAKAQLADYKVPEWLTVVDEIPRNLLGKIDRQLVAGVTTHGQSAVTARRSQLDPSRGVRTQALARHS
jgi:long-chain acyl-CoA synthetase